MPRTVILLHCNEPDGVLLSDSAGNLDDLAPDADSIAPPSVSTFTGKGRLFEDDAPNALLAADLPGRDTLLTRDVTIQAILSLTLDPDVHVPIARGLRDGTASERYCYGIEMQQQLDFPGFIEARWFWQDGAGAFKVQPGGVWKHPGDSKLFLFTATRRWETPTKVVLRYYIGAELIAELESVDGDISGGTTGHTTVGGRKMGGNWDGVFSGVLDELLVTDHEMSPEEVRHTWRRLTEFQPAGVDMFAGLIPPGLPWFRDPSNSVGRTVKHAGEALGLAVAGAEELRAMWLPDAAPLGVIEKWERLIGVSPRVRDSLDVRRARVVGYLAREEGFRHPSVQESLSGLLALAPDDVELLEFTNTQTDAFDTLNTAERWISDVGTWSIVANKLHLSLAAASDVRWESVLLGCHLRMGVDNGGNTTGLYVSAKLAAHSMPANTGIGLMLACRRTNNVLYFGVFNNAGTVQLGYRVVTANVPGAWVSLGAAAAAYWLRITPSADDTPGEYQLCRSVTGPDTGFTIEVISIGLTDFDWVGFGVFGTSAATAAIATADWDDFLAHAPGGHRTFNWYSFRDPMLAGSPDMIGANLLTQRIKPAHTHAAAIQSKSLLAGNERDGRCGRGPCGGF